MQESEAGIFVGIDWATEAHRVCVLGPNRRVLGERSVEHTAAALTGLAEWLIRLAGGKATAVAVAIEVPRGAVVETLLERQHTRLRYQPKADGSLPRPPHRCGGQG